MLRAWLLRGGIILLGGFCLWALLGALLGHDPNHDIDLERARAAARRVHTPPDPGVALTPGASPPIRILIPRDWRFEVGDHRGARRPYARRSPGHFSLTVKEMPCPPPPTSRPPPTRSGSGAP